MTSYQMVRPTKKTWAYLAHQKGKGNCEEVQFWGIDDRGNVDAYIFDSREGLINIKKDPRLDSFVEDPL